MTNECEIIPIENYLKEDVYLYDFFKTFLSDDKKFYIFCESQCINIHVSQLNISYFLALKSYCLPEKPFQSCTDDEKKLFIKENESKLDYFKRLKAIYLRIRAGSEFIGGGLLPACRDKDPAQIKSSGFGAP